MSPFSKYEAVGIFLSIAIMAIALSVVRFKTDIFLSAADPLSQEAAVVAVGSDNKSADALGLENALKDSMTLDGELVNLVIDDVRIGKGAEVKKGDTVSVHYIGTTRDGVQFDSSYARGEPFSFSVGQGKVIKGWEEGLIGMHVGGQRILVIPAEMAYGNRQVGPIPPNTPLVFAIELLGIQ